MLEGFLLPRVEVATEALHNRSKLSPEKPLKPSENLKPSLSESLFSLSEALGPVAPILLPLKLSPIYVELVRGWTLCSRLGCGTCARGEPVALPCW